MEVRTKMTLHYIITSD